MAELSLSSYFRLLIYETMLEWAARDSEENTVSLLRAGALHSSERLNPACLIQIRCHRQQKHNMNLRQPRRQL